MARRYTLHRPSDPNRSRRWLAACFNVCTGDIEDAPAPAALHSFKTSISDGKILVTADEERVAKANMSRQPKVPANADAGLTSGNAGVVIVGGGSGTFHSIISLREVCMQEVSMVLPVSISDGCKAWLRRSNHRRVEGTVLAHRQVTASRVVIHLIQLSNGTCRPKLSKSLVTDVSKVEWRTAADLRIKFGATLRTSTVRGSPALFTASSLRV